MSGKLSLMISVLYLREVLRCTMITHQVLLRGAAQCFLLNSALSLTDVVRHYDVFEAVRLWYKVMTFCTQIEC